MTDQTKIKLEKDHQNIISEKVDSDVKVSTDTPTKINNNNNNNDDKLNPSESTTTGKSSSTTTNKKDKPKAFTIKYKRPRGSRACTVCRSRKVRCDAEIHIPCTNCITFGCDCILPEVKKRGNQSGESKAKKQKTAANSKTPTTTTTTTTTANGNTSNGNSTGKTATAATATKSNTKEKNYTNKNLHLH